MRVLQVGPLVYRVPPEKYGGTELVVYNLMKGLSEKGIGADLIGTRGSSVAGGLIELCEPLGWGQPQKLAYYEYLQACKALEMQEDYDLIHVHYYPHNPQWFFSLLHFRKPVLFTLHSHLEGFARLYRRFEHLRLAPVVSISNNQREPLPFINYISTVYNGIDVSLYPYEEKKEDFLVFIGRICFEKGVAESIQVAKRLGMKLYILGKIDTPEEKDYYERYVKEHVDNKKVVMVGEVGHAEKVEYLKRARAFVFPMQWREPFGLVMIEAMACGTPVFVPARGSAPEIVIHGKTGALVKVRKKPKFMDEELIEGLVKALKRYLDRISPADCRRQVEENFTYQKMTENYLQAYSKLLQGWEELRKRLDSINPHSLIR